MGKDRNAYMRNYKRMRREFLRACKSSREVGPATMGGNQRGTETTNPNTHDSQSDHEIYPHQSNKASQSPTRHIEPLKTSTPHQRTNPPELIQYDMTERDFPMDDADFQRYLFQRMDNINAKLDIILETLSEIKKQGTGPTTAKVMELLPRPLTTKNEVDVLEEKVYNNPEDRAAMLRLFSQIKSASPAEMTKFVLNRLMDCSAAQFFNIRGNGQKVSFKAYHLCDIIFEAVQSAYPAQDTEWDVNRTVVNFFGTAIARLKRRSAKAEMVRAKRQKVDDANDDITDEADGDDENED